MYEEKKFKLEIEWKSLIIKLLLLIVIVFLICFIIFKPKKENNLISLDSNITNLKKAAIKYYKENLEIEEIGEYQKVTLKKLQKNNYIDKQVDNDNNSCNGTKSYAYLSKIKDNEFTLKINMYCGKNEESKIFNLNADIITEVAKTEEKEKAEELIETPIKEELAEEEETKTEEEIIKKPNEKNEIADSSSETKNNTETIYFNNEKLIVELQNSNSDKKVRYKHIKYGEWIEGTNYGNSIENSTKKVTFYKFCLNNNCYIDRSENAEKYIGYTANYDHTENIPIYRFIYVVWSNSCCIKGFINTGITEYR